MNSNPLSVDGIRIVVFPFFATLKIDPAATVPRSISVDAAAGADTINVNDLGDVKTFGLHLQSFGLEGNDLGLGKKRGSCLQHHKKDTYNYSQTVLHTCSFRYFAACIPATDIDLSKPLKAKCPVRNV